MMQRREPGTGRERRMHTMILQTHRTILRPFIETDLDDLYEYCSQPGVGDMAGWRPHTTRAESQCVLNENMSHPNMLAIVYKDEAKVIGHIAVRDDSEDGRDDTKELGFVLHQRYQRRGIMTEVVHAVVDALFSGDIMHIYACCFQENIPSKGLIEACGFELEQEGTFYSPSLGKNFVSFEYVLHNRGEAIKIETVNKNNHVIAVVSGAGRRITDVQSALELMMTVQYEADTKWIVLDKELIVEDFFILSTGMAGEILQKFMNYQVKVAIYGDYTGYTSKPLKDFIYECNQGKDIFFVSTKEAAIASLAAVI